MDVTFLQQAARVTWGSELSPLLEGRAKTAALLSSAKKPMNSAESLKAAKQLSNVQRALSCPKCSALWIPGLNAKAREQRHARLNAKAGSPSRNKNKRSRSRMKRKEAEKFGKFAEKLRSKIGAEFLPEAQRAPAKYVRYTCQNDCPGSLVLPLRLPIKQERKNAIKNPQDKRQAGNTEVINGRPNALPLPVAGQNRNDNQRPLPPKPKTNKLSLSDFML